MALLNRLKSIGPGALVAAAFVGPGTVTASTLAGANFGYALLWALVFATLATIVLQEMAARLGTISGRGLGQAIRDAFVDSPWRWPVFVVIVVAIFLGNSAYEAGNLAGAALGIGAMTETTASAQSATVGLLALIAGLLLYFGRYRQLERLLLVLVALMAICFAATAVMVQPDLPPLLAGALTPQIPTGALLTVVALIGTTIVPYNLFLHASAASERFKGAGDLADARFDTGVSVGIGGLVAILITTTAAATVFGSSTTISNAVDMAAQLEPLFGAAAKYLLGLGLLAAGLSSAVAAPLATSYVLAELFAWRHNRQRLTRLTSVTVVVVGAAFALSGVQPIALILAAQVANGLMLPFIVGFLLVVMNRRSIIGEHTNGWWANLCGAAVLLVSLMLAGRLLGTALGII